MERQRGDDPIFVDRTGRRRRLVAVTGSVGGLVLGLILLALVAGFTGVGPAAVPGWPDSIAGLARGARPEPSPTTSSARPTPGPPKPTRSGRTPTQSAAAPSAAPTSPGAELTPTPSASVTPTPRNNGRKPSRTPNPRSSKKKS